MYIRILASGQKIDVPATGLFVRDNGAVIFRDCGVWYIAPLCSCLWVDDTVISGPARLEHGTRFTVGGTSYEFSL